MKAFGFQIIRCGPDGPDAWRIAETWNAKWQAVRNGDAPPPIDLSKLIHSIAPLQFPLATVRSATTNRSAALADVDVKDLLAASYRTYWLTGRYPKMWMRPWYIKSGVAYNRLSDRQN